MSDEIGEGGSKEFRELGARHFSRRHREFAMADLPSPLTLPSIATL